MTQNRKTHIFICFLAGCVLLLGSKCKKDPPPDPPPDDTITCTSNITDGCFDDWKVYSFAYDYINPTGEFLQTLNELAGLPPEAGGPGPATADKTTDCVQGNYAVKLTSSSFQPTGTLIFIPGYVGASVLDIPNATVHLGKPYALRPQKLQAYYKYAPVSGDSALFQVLLTKYNTELSKRDTISYDRITVKSAVANYTLMDISLTYNDMINNPDTLTLLFSSSAAVNFIDLMGAQGQEGSTLWLDDVKFVFP